MSTSKAASERPITPNMKISEVLKEHPELLDVLIAQSPHFTRLKNPVLRRVMPKLVTVAQAAEIGGMEPAALVKTLNAAIGQTSAPETPQGLRSMVTSRAGAPEPPWVSSAQIAARLDAREDQRKHSDPFARIMAEIPKVQDGQVFYLRNTFEPFPLYDVLGKRGFIAWARKLGPEDWEIFFCKVGKGQSEGEEQTRAPSKPGAAPIGEIDTEAPVATITIDVRDLTPPQPMMKILDGLANLKPGETLLVHHQRQPVHLFPKLVEMGYTYKAIERGPNQVDLYIRKT